MKMGVKEMKREYKKVNIDDIEVSDFLCMVYIFFLNFIFRNFMIYPDLNSTS